MTELSNRTLRSTELGADRPPNIVLIVADYLGYGDLGSYGASDIRTPNLDRLASQGVRFTDHYAAAPVCGPSRAALMTGHYPARLGFETNITRAEDGLPAHRSRLVPGLKKAGYTSALFGKWHLGRGRDFEPEAHGFDRFFGFHSWTIGYHDHRTPTGEPGLYRGTQVVDECGYLTDLLSRESVSFVEEQRDTPFFLYLAYNAGLPPYQTPNMDPSRWQAAWDVNQATRADLVAMVESLDQGIGQVLSALERSGNTERTLVVFTYDHGGRHLVRSEPLFHGFRTVWEGGIRVPLIARWPGRLEPGSTNRQPSISMDLVATLLDAAGRPSDTAGLDGISLLPCSSDARPPCERPFFWRHGTQKAARIGPWKLVVDGETQLLFHLETDIGEKHDVFREQPEVTRRLRNALAQWERSLHQDNDEPFAGEPRSPALRAQVEAERRALRLIAKPEIQQSLNSLEAEWRDKSPGLLPESYAQLQASIQEVAFFVALEVVDGDPRRPQVIEISAAPHRWFGSDIPGGRWGINNPDTLYFTIPVEPDSSYVIHGQRHGLGPIDSNFTLQTPDVFGAVANVGHVSLELAPNGSYRITVDSQPANGRPNHLQIRAGATQVLIRNTLADWSKEAPDTLTVERVAGPDAGPPLSEEALAKEVIRRLAAVIAHSVNHLQPPILRCPANFIPQPGVIADKPGFLVTQRNALSHFRLADDEALVATFDPGGAGYATFPVTNVWGISPDSRRHQNSLNTKQAIPNPDATITVVVANWDPGIANWIDPGGLREGIVMLRWQLLAPPIGVSIGPAVTARLVKRSELPAALPASIQRITSKERRQQATERATAFDRRFAAR